MARTKGVGFLGARAFVTARFGPGAWNDVLSALDAPDREALARINAFGFFDLGLFARLLRTIDTRFGAGDLALVEAVGRVEAERQITTAKKWVLSLMPVTFSLDRLAKTWSRWHDSGTWRVEVLASNATLCLDDLGIVDAAICRELEGYLPRTLELLGAHDVHVEHVRCRARGDTSCDFSARWR